MTHVIKCKLDKSLGAVGSTVQMHSSMQQNLSLVGPGVGGAAKPLGLSNTATFRLLAASALRGGRNRFSALFAARCWRWCCALLT